MDEVAEGEADASPIGLPENNTPTENISLSIKQVGNSPLRAPRTIQVTTIELLPKLQQACY